MIGGANMKKQINALKRGIKVAIGTPGRLNDHIARGTLNLSTVDTLVLDEADRMLDMGFLPQIQRILSVGPQKAANAAFLSDHVGLGQKPCLHGDAGTGNSHGQPSEQNGTNR